MRVCVVFLLLLFFVFVLFSLLIYLPNHLDGWLLVFNHSFSTL